MPCRTASAADKRDNYLLTTECVAVTVNFPDTIRFPNNTPSDQSRRLAQASATQ
jgi:hypothetical protein